jgi:hypothetical protein
MYDKENKSMVKRSSFYEVINFQGKKLIASPEREFIYLLLLNIPNVDNHKPFYVGHSPNLSVRLANHSEVNWHYKRFETPVKVFIVGTVKKREAEAAKTDLINALDGEHYHLNNFIINRKTVTLEILTTEAIIDYASAATSENVSPIVAWGERWKVKTAVPTSSVEENNMYDIKKYEIHDFIDSLEMVGSVRNLANKVAESFDENKGYAVYAFQKTDKDLINRMNHIWYVTQHKYHVPVKIKLTKRTIDTILDSR